MKILIITPSVKPGSGWGRYSHELTTALKAKGLFLDILAEDNNTKLRPTNSFFSFMCNIFTVRKNAKNVDVVHAFEGWPHAVYGYFAVLGTKKKLVITGVGTYSVRPLDNLVKGFFLRRAYYRAAVVACISRYTRDQILKRVKNISTSVIYLGSTKLEHKKVSKLFDHHNHHPVILTVGALKERKGQLDTLKAVEILKKSYPNIMYIMAGSQSDEYYVPKIKDQIRKSGMQKNTLLCENVSDSELASLYEGASVFALNSNNIQGNFEGFGLVILEANQFGKPSVGSRNCGIEDAIKVGVTGYLCNQGDHQDIANKINLSLELKNPEIIKDSTKGFSWNKTAEEYKKLYQN